MSSDSQFMECSEEDCTQVEHGTSQKVIEPARGSFANRGYVVITGAAGMLGSSLAKRVVRDGGKVALIDIPAVENKLIELKNSIGKSDTLLCTLDIRQQDEVDEMIHQFEARDLQIYGLFNNAGVQGEIQPIYSTTMDDFQTLVDINVTGAFRVLRAVTKYMIDRKQNGAVVSTSSTAWQGVPNMIGYSMSKAAIVGMTGSAAKDLAPFGIRVNCVAPGHIGGFMWDRKTEAQAKLRTQYWPHGDPKAVGEAMIKKVPQRRAADADEITNVVAFLLSEEASFVTGQNWRISGGE